MAFLRCEVNEELGKDGQEVRWMKDWKLLKACFFGMLIKLGIHHEKIVLKINTKTEHHAKFLF
jgi:hypothetical protein